MKLPLFLLRKPVDCPKPQVEETSILNRPRYSPLRKLMFQLHLWIGLALGLYVVVVCVTGSLVVFRGEIEDVLHSDLTRVTPGPRRMALQPVYEAVKQAHPGDTLRTINLPPAPDAAWSLWFTGPKGKSFHAYANPYTGKILGDDLANDNLTEWLYDLHANLLAGGTGEKINGIAAMFFGLLCLSGVVIWWPGRGRVVKQGLTIQWRSQWKRLNYDLHKVLGIASAGLLLLVIVTGVYFPFPQPFRAIAEWLGHPEIKAESPRSRPRPVARWPSLDEAIATANSALPEGEVNWIGLPQKPHEDISVRKRIPGDWRLTGSDYVHLDQYTGAVISVERHAERSPGQRFLRAMFPLHTGTFGGLFTRLLWAMLGLVPALLFVTGFLMWWNRVVRPRRAAAANAIPNRLTVSS